MTYKSGSRIQFKVNDKTGELDIKPTVLDYLKGFTVAFICSVLFYAACVMFS
jgi:hypothetical protein